MPAAMFAADMARLEEETEDAREVVEGCRGLYWLLWDAGAK